MKKITTMESKLSKLLVKACDAKLTSQANCASSVYLYEMKRPKTLKRFKK